MKVLYKNQINNKKWINKTNINSQSKVNNLTTYLLIIIYQKPHLPISKVSTFNNLQKTQKKSFLQNPFLPRYFHPTIQRMTISPRCPKSQALQLKENAKVRLSHECQNYKKSKNKDSTKREKPTSSQFSYKMSTTKLPKKNCNSFLRTVLKFKELQS